MAQSTASSPRPNSSPSAISSASRRDSLPQDPLASSRRGGVSSLPPSLAGAHLHPLDPLGIFLSQVLSDDHSCDDAVSRFQKFRYDQGSRGLPRRAATARPANVCPRSSSGTWSAGPADRSIKGEATPGSSTADRSRSSTAPPWSCPTPRRTRRRTPSRTPRRPAWGSRSPASSWSSAWPWARCSRPRWDPTRASRPASWPCSGRSSTSSSPATSSWPTGSSARTG